MRYFIYSLLLIVAILSFSAHSPSRAEPWYHQHCQDQQSLAGVRDCITRHQALEAKKLDRKRCNSKACIYKLRPHGRTSKSREFENLVFKGEGYTFIERDDSIPKNDEGYPGGKLIEADGTSTTMRTCIGSWCEGKYFYGSGPLNGAELTPIYEDQSGDYYWLLRVPR